MLGELHDLALGPVTPIVAVIFASLGGLHGMIVAARARRSTGVRRIRLIVYGTVSVAGTGIWLPGLVGVPGLSVDGSVVRVDPAMLALSFAAAAVAAAAALILLCFGHAGLVRLLGGAVLLAGGIGGSTHLMLRSLATGGPILADPTIAAAGYATTIVAGLVLSLLLGATRSLRRAVAAALPLGLVMSAAHMVATAALSVGPGPGGPIPAYEVPGLSPMRIVLPAVVLGGVLTAMLWYFSIGTATRRDLRVTFDPEAEGDQIDPWMIDQVRSRVALSSTALAPRPGWPGAVWAETTVAVRSIPLLGGTVASAFARPRYSVLRPPEPAGPATRAGGPADQNAERGPAMVIPGDLGETTAAPASGGQRVAGGEPPPWRPVPGWGVPAASRSLLSPDPTTATSVSASPRSGEPAWWDTRTGSQWDQRDRDAREPVERNQSRPAGRTRTANSRPRQFPAGSSAPDVLVPAGREDQGASPATPPPLPRRNARR